MIVHINHWTGKKFHVFSVKQKGTINGKVKGDHLRLERGCKIFCVNGQIGFKSDTKE